MALRGETENGFAMLTASKSWNSYSAQAASRSSYIVIESNPIESIVVMISALAVLSTYSRFGLEVSVEATLLPPIARTATNAMGVGGGGG